MAQIRLRTALIGVGAWGRVLAKAASQSDKMQFAYCSGRNPERLAAFARDTGIPGRADVDAVLADRDIAALKESLRAERTGFATAQARDAAAMKERHQAEDRQLQQAASARRDFDRVAEVKGRVE